ncbi:uncharacterized protein NPIL_264901 [Nephila pilipes]|uniref:Uncharacterized protein n=1 Tax=Nephila pilipes TaxID=299642 RepID=A0A8X6NWS3_NEPPI|nr:uncharacterized protein NPIL_264901 [Nephila pilipes]
MNSIILSGFVALLVVVCVQSQDANRCGVLGRKCRDGQYCYRPNENLKNVEYCRAYRGKGFDPISTSASIDKTNNCIFSGGFILGERRFGTILTSEISRTFKLFNIRLKFWYIKTA